MSGATSAHLHRGRAGGRVHHFLSVGGGAQAVCHGPSPPTRAAGLAAAASHTSNEKSPFLNRTMKKKRRRLCLHHELPRSKPQERTSKLPLWGPFWSGCLRV